MTADKKPEEPEIVEETAAEAEPTVAMVTLPQAEVDALKANADGFKDKYARALAEMENLRNRTTKEVTLAKKFAIQGFAKDLLSLSDNLARAISSLDTEEAKAMLDADAGDDKTLLALQQLHQGLVLTDADMKGVFKRNGMVPMDVMGKKFDPNFHEAMFEVPNPDVEAGTIMAVTKEGFMIKDRVLRVAQVGLSKK